MGKTLLVCLLLASSTTANAQAPTAAAPAQWVRLSLADGRTVDGQITGGDAASHFVQTPHGYFSIPRANVTAITPLAPAAPAAPVAPAASVAPSAPPTYAPPPTYGAPVYVAPPAPPTAERPAGREPSRRTVALRVGGGTYLLTAMIALARTEKDDDAKLGFIPIIGPLAWSVKNDDDSFLEDGWDWLALGSTIVQAAGVFGMITGDDVKKNSLVHVTPVGTRDYGGLAVGGRW